MRTVIAFDVVDDRRRARLAKALLSFAHRVQKSVFEADSLVESVFLRMRSRAERHLDHDTDRIRYYRLCAACAGRIESAGLASPVPKDGDDFRIV